MVLVTVRDDEIPDRIGRNGVFVQDRQDTLHRGIIMRSGIENDGNFSSEQVNVGVGPVLLQGTKQEKVIINQDLSEFSLRCSRYGHYLISPGTKFASQTRHDMAQ
jgi:hypothetical protein